MGCVLIEKNATARGIKATQRSMKPTPIIVKTAPISINNPVVPKRPTPAFSERVVNDLLKKMAATTTNTKRATKVPMMAAI